VGLGGLIVEVLWAATLRYFSDHSRTEPVLELVLFLLQIFPGLVATGLLCGKHLGHIPVGVSQSTGKSW